MARAALIVAIFGAACACAQPPAPAGVLRGDFLAWSGTAAAGEITLRTVPEMRVFQCAFNSLTWVERDGARATIARIDPGERMELVADRIPGRTGCYARMVRVIDVVHAAYVRSRLQHHVKLAGYPPRGDFTFAGVVERIDDDTLVLKTADRQHETLLLRSDTRYMGNGLLENASAVHRHMRVFVRAGRTNNGAMEAYQVMWGQILKVDE